MKSPFPSFHQPQAKPGANTEWWHLHSLNTWPPYVCICVHVGVASPTVQVGTADCRCHVLREQARLCPTCVPVPTTALHRWGLAPQCWNNHEHLIMDNCIMKGALASPVHSCSWYLKDLCVRQQVTFFLNHLRGKTACQRTNTDWIFPDKSEPDSWFLEGRMGNSTSHSPNYPGRLVCAPRLWTKNNSFHLERALNIAAMQPCPPEFLVTNCACTVQ